MHQFAVHVFPKVWTLDLGTFVRSHFVVCSFLNGKLNQCTASLEELESPYYTHCWLLCGMGSISLSSPLEATNVFNVIENKDPTCQWLCYPNTLIIYHL